MVKWNRERAKKLIRRPDGTFKRWKGGKTKAELPKKQNLQHGIGTHIGQTFKAQRGRKAKTGDIHRTKNKDGTYNEHAVWYVKTAHGWRKSPTGRRRPSKAEVARICAASRKGREPE